MKIRNIFTVAALVMITIFTLSACQSKEEKVLSGYEELYEKIAADDDFDEEDMTRIAEEFQELQEKAKDCNFTSEQQKKILNTTGKIAAAMTKKMPGMLFKKGGNLLKNVMDCANGFVEGLGDEGIDDAMEDAENIIDKMFEE